MVSELFLSLEKFETSQRHNRSNTARGLRHCYGRRSLTIIVLAVINFVRALSRRGTIALQALAALLIWAFLTYAIILIFMVVIFSLPYPLSPGDEVKSNGVVLLGFVIYAAVGAALIYWTKVQPKLSLKAQRASQPVAVAMDREPQA